MSQISFTSHRPHSISGFTYFEFDIRFCKINKEKKGQMPLKLSTTIRKIQNIPNLKNIEIINEFLEYMRSNVPLNLIKTTI
jgi:hypothetical protein